jgi:flagellar hook assembly protein FlgD
LLKNTHHSKIAKGQEPRLKTHTAEWDGRDEDDKKVARGVYFYRIEAGDFKSVKKLILLR